MPAYNLGELMSFMTSNAGRRADLDASVVSRLANEAYFEVFYALEPAESERIVVSSTTTGENKIELPSDFYTPISASLIYRSGSTAASNHSSYTTLKLVRAEEIDSKNPQPSGVPQELAFFNSWMELHPSPNSAYSFQLRYKSGATDMTSTSDIPSVSTPWRRAVLMKGEELLHAYLQDPSAEAAANLRYLRYTSTLKNEMATRQQSGQFRYHLSPSWGVGGRRRV